MSNHGNMLLENAGVQRSTTERLQNVGEKLNTIQQKKKQEKDAEIIKLRPVPRDYRGYWIIQELREANKEFKDKLAMNPVFLWEYAIGGFQLGLMVVTL